MDKGKFRRPGWCVCTACDKPFKSKHALQMHKRHCLVESSCSAPGLLATNELIEPDNSVSEVFSVGNDDSLSAVSKAKQHSEKQQCTGCGRYYANVSNHKNCSRKLLIVTPSRDEENAVSESDVADTMEIDVAESPVVQNSESEMTVADEGLTSGRVLRSHGRQSADVCTSDGATGSSETSSSMNGPHVGTTRKDELRVEFELKLKRLRDKYHVTDSTKTNNDPLFVQLKKYHDLLLKSADNIVTERITAEVEAVIADLSKIDQKPKL